jgi:hypothetical protein
MASQIETKQALQNIYLIRNMLNEDLDQFGDDNSENVAQIRQILQEDINALDNYVGEEDDYQESAIAQTINNILKCRAALKNELVILEAQITAGDDIQNAKFIRDIIINDINELGNQIDSLTEFSHVNEDNEQEDE